MFLVLCLLSLVFESPGQLFCRVCYHLNWSDCVLVVRYRLNPGPECWIFDVLPLHQSRSPWCRLPQWPCDRWLGWGGKFPLVINNNRGERYPEAVWRRCPRLLFISWFHLTQGWWWLKNKDFFLIPPFSISHCLPLLSGSVLHWPRRFEGGGSSPAAVMQETSEGDGIGDVEKTEKFPFGASY